MNEKMALLLEKLQVLKDLDADYKVFGASSHKYQLFDTVDKREIDSFEGLYNIDLPIDYKLFLTEVGNGGAGPCYGLFPLGLMDEGYNTFGEWGDQVNLTKPFPFRDKYNNESILSQGAPLENNFSNSDAYMEAYDRWWDENSERIMIEYWSEHALTGAIPICHLGCAHRIWLVVDDGPERGNIWNDDSANEAGVYPYRAGDKDRYSFFEWYCNWLDSSIESLLN